MGSRKRSSISKDEDMHALYKEWDEVSCSICMDHPHNAVLLLCTSHDKGCRSYVCDTSYRHSNCLDRFKRLQPQNPQTPSPPSTGGGGNNSSGLTLTRPNESSIITHEEFEGNSNLKCPLCRGSVLGWEVMEDARKYLNLKQRNCSRESCVFTGNYRDLRRHARSVHPTARPADIDPSRQRAWRRLENQREYDDIVSAVRSAMPGAVVLGDYVIENGGERERGGGGGSGGGGGGSGGGDNGRWLSTLFLFRIGSMERRADPRGGRSRALSRHRRSFTRRPYLWGENLLGLQDVENDGENDDEAGQNDDVSINPRRRRRLARSRSDEDHHHP